MHKVLRMKAFVALLVAVVLLCQGTWVLAGTTGSISGTVVDTSTRNGIPNAKVTVVSPSQTASTYTDAKGNFTFISLAPDTYTLSVEKQGYDTVTQSGITIFADQNQTLPNIAAVRSLQTIGRVTSRAATDVIRPGAVTDVYSVNPATQSAAAVLGGGGSLTQAYSGLATVPGVQVAPGQIGWNQGVYIRGGTYTDLAYEFDGVPIQRAYDQYPSSALSALGQQELQVYAGSAPIGAQSSGLAGFINQVIKTGTYPGFANIDLAVGGPSYYHRAGIEVGGASPDRNFSYYFATAGYNQGYRNIDQFGGASYDQYYGSLYNVVGANCGTNNASAGCYHNFAGDFGSYPLGPNGFALGPLGPNDGFTNQISDRETVANVHFGIPHHKDGGKDDIQLLYDNSWLHTDSLTGLSGWNYAQPCVQSGTVTANCMPAGENGLSGGSLLTPGASTVWGGIVPGGSIFTGNSYTYLDRYLYTGQVGVPLTAANLGQVQPYYQPNSSQNRAFGAQIPPTLQDSQDNSFSIAKVQYQKNMGSNAYLRVYGYSFYSAWFYNGPNSIEMPFAIGPYPSDYELSSHTRGLGLQFADQINSQNLVNASGGYSFSNTTRWNNSTTYSQAGGFLVAALVSSANPTAGCYSTAAGSTVASPVYCGSSAASGYVLPAVNTYGTGLTPRHTTDPTVATASTFTCGGAPCQYMTVDSGLNGTINTVSPRFYNFGIEDQFKPNNKLQLNVGVHYDNYNYLLPNSNVPSGPLAGPVAPQARQLYTNSYNAYNCFYGPQALVIAAPTAGGCSSLNTPGYTYSQINFNPNSPASTDYFGFEPRFGVTYTVNPLNVLRASYGKYLEPSDSASQQYNTAGNNVAASDANFQALGFNSPGHYVQPEVSYNLDLSWEHQIKGTDMSWKITPYLRKTQNQFYDVAINPITSFVSAFNAGNLTASGLEFLFKKGDFDRNGLAAQLAFTYTYATIKYTTLPSGGTVITGINNAIATYNSYTSACAANPGLKIAGRSACLNSAGVTPLDPNTGAPVAAAPCYTAAGAADATCAAGDIANPYWNAPPQATMDPNAQYLPSTYTPFPQGPSAASYIIPYNTTLLLNYRKNRFTVTPSLQFFAGDKYGSPFAGNGIDPGAGGCAPLPTATTTDPRYRYGFPTGTGPGYAYDASTCAGNMTTPDFVTGAFDQPGAYTEPSQLVANLQLGYDISKNIKLTVTLANLYARCFGGSSTPWTAAAPNGPTNCLYQQPSAYVGNWYNPGNTIQPFEAQPYAPALGSGVAENAPQINALPFSAYFALQVKL